MVLINAISFISFSFSTSINFSSNSWTRVALRSLKALCAALFCAFLLDAGVSTLGFLPGLGLGGKTHSFDVIIRVTPLVLKLLVALVVIVVGLLFGGDAGLLLCVLGLAALLGVEPAEAEDGGDPAMAIGD